MIYNHDNIYFRLILTILLDERNNIANLDLYETGLTNTHLIELANVLFKCPKIISLDIALGDFGFGSSGFEGISALSDLLTNPNCNIQILYIGGLGKIAKENSTLIEKALRKNISIIGINLDGTVISKKCWNHISWLISLNRNIKKPFNNINYPKLVYKHLILRESKSLIYFSNANKLNKNQKINLHFHFWLYWIISKSVCKDLTNLVMGSVCWFLDFDEKAFQSILTKTIN